jgi:excisionase family DNA binding protein
MAEPELRTVAEVALEMRVSRESVYRRIRRGELEAVRFGGVIRVSSETLKQLKQPERRL